MKLIYQTLIFTLSLVLLNCISGSCLYPLSLMKLMISALLLPVSCYGYCVIMSHVIMLGCESEKECMEKLRLAMQRLAKPHFYALKYLLHHLHR